jgi:hypothetical protein
LGEGQPVARPPPRRTYGRKRASTPTDEPIPSLFTAAPPADSPSKGLLNRFANSSTSWKNSLAGLGSDDTEVSDEVEPEADPAETRARLTDFAQIPKHDSKGKGKAVDTDDSGDEPDPAALQREFDRLRQQARGEAPSSTTKTATTIPERVREVARDRNLSATFGSSSLSELPSDLSSPPKVQARSLQRSSAVEEETISVRKSGQSKVTGRRRVITESEDDEDEGDITIQHLSPHAVPDSPTPTLQADATPTLQAVYSSSHPGSPSPKRIITTHVLNRSSIDNEVDDDDDKESIHDFFADLAKESAAAEAEKTSSTQDKSSSAENVGFFNDDNEAKVKSTKPKKPKVRQPILSSQYVLTLEAIKQDRNASYAE